ncbi:apyrase isoform X2 [Leptidea sinapis]|uniref:apyrase isoform X1 n=1 Tax=Leptidea sinapis TaxID=189913 RepID=UPI00213CA7AB|nr:apyrase isoform X1 [Leptidea sinapis]XP_050679296.1 apyrase isoform X2 [Leptidea sinapis]
MLNYLTVFVAIGLVCGDLYELNIIHYNDFHARFVETSPSGGVCNPTVAPCIGGFARLVTLIRESVEKEPHSLVLNGGDTFQGTIWYNLLRWNVTQEFMNMIHHDAHVLGNHEFDHGLEGVVPYLEHLEHEVVTANIIDDEEPTIQGLYKPSIVVNKNGRNIGIIGVIIATTDELASTGKLRFTDEIETVKAEAEKLNEQGVDIIVVLSHCGIDIDREIALHGGPHIDIVVGGHSHTLLYNGDPPENSTYGVHGPYPIVVEKESGPVLIVQAAAHTEYLGEIKLFFNETGHLQHWIGNPHYVGHDIEQAPDVIEKINVYLPDIEALAKQKIGESKVFLSSSCRCGECNLGSLMCDAFLNSVMHNAEGDNWHHAHFCVVNSGGVRSSIEPGDITYEGMLLAMPFDNTVEVFDLLGEHIMEMLEFSVTNEPWPGATMLQFSGLRVNFDGSRPINQRVVNVTVRCIDCDIPRYEPLELNKVYKVVSQSFMANGGDGFRMVSENKGPSDVIGVDNTVFQDYLERRIPVIRDLDGRIQINEPCLPN